MAVISLGSHKRLNGFSKWKSRKLGYMYSGAS
jgi:hypothetical protein